MNERIKELIDQAGFVRYTEDENSLTPIDWSCDYSRELDKFAELIVRECLAEIRSVTLPVVSRSSCAFAQHLHSTDKVAKHIEQHFGVE